jgi:hypothetical protein
LPDEKDDLGLSPNPAAFTASKIARSKKRNFSGNVKYSCSNR